MFGTPLSALVTWCRALKHGLGVGLSPVRVFRQQAKSGPAALRPVANRVADRLEAGESLEEALRPDAGKFPVLFLELVTVGEHSGRLTDVFGELEHYFEALLSTRREFVRMLAWPALQYVGAILIVTFLIFILGVLSPTMDVLGLGLTGTAGALTFFLGMATVTAVVVGVLVVVARDQHLRAKGEAFALNIPGIGGCFRAFALHRFCLAFHMSAEAGMRADRCLKLSLRATANEAYAREAEPAAKAARKGEDVPSILGGYGDRLFPHDFVNVLQIGEDSGQLAEVLRKQADEYREESQRKLRLLSRIANGAVYAFVGLLLIVLILKIVTTAYLNPLNDAMKAADDPQGWMRGR